MSYLCIDIGATKTFMGVGQEDFKSIVKYDTVSFLDNTHELVKEFAEPDLQCVAVAVPGTMDTEKGVFYPPNLPGREVDIRGLLESVVEDHILINDCSAGVVGEYFYGGERESDMVYISISTGIGSGVIVDDRLVLGCSGNFAEVGHMKVGGTKMCGCGGKGHWEAYCSGSNLPGFAEYITGERIDDASVLFKKYHEGDPGARKVIEKMREYNAAGMANVINAYAPELIVLGGGVVVNNPETILDGLSELIDGDILIPPPRIVTTSLGANSVMYGLLGLCDLHDGPGPFGHRSFITLS